MKKRFDMNFNFFKDYFKTKASFIYKPELEFNYEEKGVRYYTLHNDLIFFNGKENIIIKKNTLDGVFFTNLATIPKFLTSIVKPNRERLKYASVLHDGLYDDRSLYNRLYADWMFLLALKVEKENFFIRWAAFFAVRIFGRDYKE